ncbi:MAG: hypothetical protein FWF41_01490 [Betaproteobacteria bacterium]|nr:hypothetical protein [Betaproteobacteria bacterium]
MGLKRIRFFKDLRIIITLVALVFSVGTAMSAPVAHQGTQSATHPTEPSSAPLTTGAPPSLQVWNDWVRYQQEFRRCPLMAGAVGSNEEDFLCAWPGVLTLEVNDKGAAFTQLWQVMADSWVPLPGDSRDWPQEVTVNGSPQPVLPYGEIPAVWLTAGEYHLRGRILWQERPQALTIPSMSALVALSINGKPVQPLQRKDNRLTLGRSTAAANEAADTFDLQVYRKLTDGVPAQLTTLLQLQVSGKAREIRVAPVLPESFVATALESPWPARLDDEGHLQIQVQPGQATLILTARALTPLTQLQARLPETLTQEVWSYEAAPSLRMTTVTTGGSAMSVDPRQAGVPTAWQSLPAFAMSANSGLGIEERSRGLAADETNRLTLGREMWLDFSGEGYFAKDAIRGTMQQGWRFDMAAPHQLQRAGVGGEALLVTHGVGEKSTATRTGVEWRSPQVALDASVRIAAGPSSALPVTGWQQTFDQVNTSLHLPYGYKLLAAPGADAANDSWVARWTILDIFFAAFTALLAWRLLGLGGGIVTAAYLLLALQEPGAPLWTLAVVLALGLLHRALSSGRLGKVLQMLQYAALAVLFLTAIVFAPSELRPALYPQLERSDNGYYAPQQRGMLAQQATSAGMPPPPTTRYGDDDAYEEAPMARQPSAPAASSAGSDIGAKKRETASILEGKVLKQQISSSSAPNKASQRYAQTNVVQTGIGEPDWRVGQYYNLRWTGPVLADQTVRFIISPPWLTRLLRVAMIVLLGVILWRALRATLPGGLKRAINSPPTSLPPQEKSDEKTDEKTPPAAASALAVMVAIGVLAGAAWLHPMSASAQSAAAFPSSELLQALQERVNQPPRCAAECADIAMADIRAQGSTLLVNMEAHAGDSVALPLPAVEDNTMLMKVRADGRVVETVRSYQKTAYVALSRGVHLVELEYITLGRDTSLHFTLRPRRVLFKGQGWRADGLDENRLINETVHLSRASVEAAGTADPAARVKEGGAQQFPPYIRVTRTLRFDLDWTVNTVVTRVSPREGGVTLTVPLLAGEHVTTPGIKVQDDTATVSLGHTEAQTQWQSRLDKSEVLRLTAPTLAERAEVWRMEVSPSWHARWEGVPVTLLDNGGETMFEFHPLPGETLALTLAMPSVVDGSVRAIDHVEMNHEIGIRASQYTLSFRLRASQGGEHVITLPSSEMEVLSVMRNRESLNLRPIDGKLTLPVSPGEQTFTVTLREPREVGTLTRTPVFDLGLPVANIDIGATLPKQRWLLASFGPPVGPAVLYWGELVVALVLAFLLSFLLARRGWTSLRFHHWFLLVLGFSTFSWAALALIAVWLIALDWRRRAGALVNWKDWQFNGVQVGLVLLSAAALYCLVRVIPNGLLGMPDMGVVGHGSSGNQLQWFADQSGGQTPTVTLISLPMWVYRTAMLVWALWLALAVIGWLRRGLAAWMQGGYWRKSLSAKPLMKSRSKAAAKADAKSATEAEAEKEAAKKEETPEKNGGDDMFGGLR